MLISIIPDKGWHGRTDQVAEPMLFERRRASVFVATKFYHWNAVPLVPLGSYAILAAPGWAEELELIAGLSQPWAAIRIPLNLKSVSVAYLRAVIVLAFLPMLIGSIVLIRHHRAEYGAYGFAGLIFCLSAPVVVVLSYRCVRASAKRAQTLRELFISAGLADSKSSQSHEGRTFSVRSTPTIEPDTSDSRNVNPLHRHDQHPSQD